MMNSIILEKSSEYTHIDYDGLWKKLIYELFEEFILFFIPDLHEHVDFSKEPEFLQQELFQEIIQEKKGKRVADQVVKVHLKNGAEKWLLIHIEVQGERDPHFSKRMFRYYYRLFDRYDKDIIAIALLTDATNSFRPDMYHRSTFGTTLTYTYNTYKFFDQDEEALLQSNNPFAFAVLAGRFANESKHDAEKRYEAKVRLMRFILRKKDFPHEERRQYITALIYFIDYLLQVPPELTKRLRDEIMLTEEVKEMFYLDRKNPPPTWREVEQMVREEEMRRNQREIAKKMLKRGYSIKEIEFLTELPEEEIRKL